MQQRSHSLPAHAIIADMPRPRAVPSTSRDPDYRQDSLYDSHSVAEATRDVLPAAAGRLDIDRTCSALESLLFVAGRPLSRNELQKLLEIDSRQLETAVAALSDRCRQPGRGLLVQWIQDQVQLVSAPENARVVAALLGMPSHIQLTQAALETLAVVAYRQPITRSQIEFIRGVNSDRALSTLVQYGLVIEVGRSPTVGRPVLFGTTADFLQQFGLTSLDALPAPSSPETEALEAGRLRAARRIRKAVDVSSAGVGEDGDGETGMSG